MSKLSEQIVNAEQLGLFFDLRPRQIQRLAAEKGLPKTGRNAYPLLECVRWYIQELQTKPVEKDSELAEERRLLVRAQRTRVELENAKRKGELIDRESVAIMAAESATIYATSLDGLPQRAAGELPVMTSVLDIQKYLTNECRAIRTAASGRFLDFADAQDPSGDRVTPAKRKRRRGS